MRGSQFALCASGHWGGERFATNLRNAWSHKTRHSECCAVYPERVWSSCTSSRRRNRRLPEKIASAPLEAFHSASTTPIPWGNCRVLSHQCSLVAIYPFVNLALPRPGRSRTAPLPWAPAPSLLSSGGIWILSPLLHRSLLVSFVS